MQNFITNFSHIKFKVLAINFLCIFILSNDSFSEELEKHNYEFKSIKSNNANMRIGPGKRFEILWNFKKVGLPVKILKKFEQWYEIETPDGSIGWMWSKLLSSKEKTIIFKKKDIIYRKDSIDSNIVANVSKNSILNIYYCKNKWCKVESKKDKVKGYVKIDNIWGFYTSSVK